MATMIDVDQARHFAHCAINLLAIHLDRVQRKGDIVINIHGGIHTEVLEDHGDAAILRRQIGDIAVFYSDASAIRLNSVTIIDHARPAIMRKVVVLPQPEGPSKTANSPEPMTRLILLTAARHRVLQPVLKARWQL